jgi:YD repeat-containing protein
MDSNPVYFTITSQALPFTWLDIDVGAVGVAGNATFSNGTFTVNGAGSQIWNSADSFHYVYQPLSGDGVIVARLASFSAASSYGSAGVMIRETLATGSTHGDVDRTDLGQGSYFCNLTYRTTTNGSTSNQQGPVVQTLPYWLKVVRNGNAFTGFTSPDGVNWTQDGATQTISMATNVYIGFVLSSGTTSALATATFDNVSVTAPFSTTGTVAGTITQASNGAVVGGAQVQAVQSGATKAAVNSDVNGNYEFPNIPAGSYDIWVSASGFGTSVNTAVSIPAGALTTLNVALSAPGSAAGTVTQSDGVTPISGATVQAFVGPSLVASATTASNGTYTLSGLNAGNYQVAASANGYVAAMSAASITANQTTTENFSLQSQSAGALTYIYDALGRLIAAVKLSGDTAIYNYDSVGNIVSISRQNSGQLSILTFTPGTGTVGSTVTIYGTGFIASPGQNAVSFNGTTATVVSASATQLVVTVPTGATTGTISVTTPAGTATSSASFTVSH